jgi:hypothetical protein
MAYLILLGSDIPDFAGRSTVARLQLDISTLVAGL